VSTESVTTQMFDGREWKRSPLHWSTLEDEEEEEDEKNNNNK